MTSSQAFTMDSSNAALVASLVLLLEQKGNSTAAFAAYEPGELLRKEVQESYDCDNISSVSTTDFCYCSEKTADFQADFDADGENVGEESSLPSLGSADHHLGSCSPCAYFHRGGCADGLECSFCHLCPPGSIELKRKMKRKLMKTMRNARKALQ